MKRLVSRFKHSAGASKDARIAAESAASDTDGLITAKTESVAEPAEAGRESAPNWKQNHESKLESLPPEIRRQILSTLDLARLKAVVRASPAFHQQYLFDRNHLLCTSLETTLDSVTVDAYAVSQYATQRKDTRQDSLLKLYSTKISRQFLPLVGKLTLEETLKIVFFYFQLVKPLIEYYARWTLDNLAEEAGEDACGEVALTSMETLRLTRAIYRFQLLCQLADPVDTAIMSSRGETVRAFLDLLEPWEIEEVFSFYQFAQDAYDRKFKHIRWNLHPSNPKFDDQRQPPTPEGAFVLDNLSKLNYSLSYLLTLHTSNTRMSDRDNYLEGLTLRGVPLLHTVLFQIKDHQHLVSTIQQHLASSYIPFNAIEGVLGETQQASRRENHPSERDRMQEERAPFPFRGDSESDAPPLAWTMIWNGTYSNLYGWYISDEMRRWGYVFWDAARLEVAGGKEFLKHQWGRCWEDDPRDDLI